MRLACLGDVGVDHYLNGNDKFLGGCSLNLARAFRAIIPESEISFFGPRLETFINHPELLKHRFHFIGPTATGEIPIQGIRIDQKGEKNFSPYQAGAWENFFLPNHFWQKLFGFDIAVAVCFEQNLPYINGFFEWKKSVDKDESIPFICMDFLSGADFQYRFELLLPYLNEVDLPVFGLDEEGMEKLGPALEHWSFQTKRDLLLTLGGKGSLFYQGDSGQKISTPAAKVARVIDTTGAGDCFLGAFLGNWKGRGLSLAESLASASAMAAEKIQHWGPCHLDVMTLAK